MKRPALLLALAALLVSGPRLAVIFLAADGVALPTAIEGSVMAVTGIATAAVLTGGNMLLAHTVAGGRTRGGWVWALALAWLAQLAFSVVLIAPSLVLAVRANGLDTVLDTDRTQWTWAIVAVLSVEVMAAAAMVADAALRTRPAMSGHVADRPSIVAALTGRLVRSLDSDRTVAAPDRTVPDTPAKLPDTPPTVAAPVAVVPDTLPDMTGHAGQVTAAVLAAQLGVSERTARRKLAEYRAKEAHHV